MLSMLGDLEDRESALTECVAAMRAEACNPLRAEHGLAVRLAETRPDGGRLVLDAAGCLARALLLRLGAARVVETENDGELRFWDFASDAALGRRCAILPIWRRDRWGGERLVDLLALDPAEETWWALRRGAADRLGAPAVGGETRLYATPLRWLRDAPLDGDPSAGRLWLPALARVDLVELSGGALVCCDDAHAKWLHRALGADWRRFIEVRVTA